MNSALINAYLATQYWVDAPDQHFYFQIHCHSDKLHKLHQQYRVTHSAYLTAYNPQSQLCAIDHNISANQALVNDIQALGLAYLTGRGVASYPEMWPGEESYLVMGISLSEAINLGKRYHQYAIVMIDETAVPKLHFLSSLSNLNT